MTTKFKGIKVTLGERDLVVPPLNFRALQQFQERLVGFSGGVDPQSVALVLDVVEASLQRNYTDITREWLEEVLDVGNMQEVMEACMDVSGLKRKAQEQEASSGDPSTGPSSTPT
jgi:hypothetical protein